MFQPDITTANHAGNIEIPAGLDKSPPALSLNNNFAGKTIVPVDRSTSPLIDSTGDIVIFPPTTIRLPPVAATIFVPSTI